MSPPWKVAGKWQTDSSDPHARTWQLSALLTGPLPELTKSMLEGGGSCRQSTPPVPRGLDTIVWPRIRSKATY